MPGFYTAQCCMKEMDRAISRLLATSRRGYTEEYMWNRPISSFDWPMDQMTKVPGEPVAMTEYQMLAECCRNGRTDWWFARCYGNYANNLDWYIWFGRHPGDVYHYELFTPVGLYEGRAPDSRGIYVDPRDWYLCERRVYRHTYTEAEFDLFWATMGTTAIGDDETPAVDAAIAGTGDPIDSADAQLLTLLELLRMLLLR